MPREDSASKDRGRKTGRRHSQKNTSDLEKTTTTDHDTTRTERRRNSKAARYSSASDDTETPPKVTPAKTHIPHDLASRKILLELNYQFHKNSKEYLIDGVLSTEDLRDILVRNNELRKQSKSTSDRSPLVDLTRYIHNRNLEFEKNLRRICRRARITPELTLKIIQEHQASQRIKTKHRQLSESSDDEEIDLIAQLARITITGTEQQKKAEQTVHQQLETDSEIESDNSDDHEDQVHRDDETEDNNEGLGTPLKQESASDSESESDKQVEAEADDISTIDIQRPQDRDHDHNHDHDHDHHRSTKMDMVVAEEEDADSTDKEQRPRSKALNRRRRGPPQTQIPPYLPSAPSNAEKQALTLIQHDNMRNKDVLLMKTLEILQDGIWFARDQRERDSGDSIYAQVLKDLREQEALFRAKEAERSEEVKRIKVEALLDEKRRQEEVERIRVQVRKEVEAEFYLVHKTEGTKMEQ